jgi:integral membrane protein
MTVPADPSTVPGTPDAPGSATGAHVPGGAAAAFKFGPIEGAFFRYKVLAFTVGAGLLILCCVGVPLQYMAGLPQVAEIVGPIHGFLYIVYLLASLDLVRRARFPLWQMALMVGAGFVPGLAFVIEYFVARWVAQVMRRDQLEAETGDGVAGDRSGRAATATS